MQIPKEYLNGYNEIVTIEKDSGDSAFHAAHWFYFNMFGDKQLTMVNGLISKEGYLRRSQVPGYWGSLWDRASRDQSMSFIIMLFHRGFNAPEIFVSHLKRGLLFARNFRKNGVIETPWKVPDYMGPFSGMWGVWIRGFRFWPLYPLLLILDLALMVHVITFNIKPREPNQLLLLLAFSRTRLPTPLSFVAWRVLNKTKVRIELARYWCDRSHGGKLWRPKFIGDLWMDYLEETK